MQPSYPWLSLGWYNATCMSIQSNPSNKSCPICGTRINPDHSRCLVCGANVSSPEKSNKPTINPPIIQGTRMPTVTLSIPLVIILFILIIALGGGMTYTALNLTGGIIEPTEFLTPTATNPPTASPTIIPPTATSTPEPSPTPLSYTVQPQDTCSEIAYIFKISVQSIILENGLSVDCSLSVGTILKIPQPTPTATPLATNTPSSQQATIEACQKVYHVVQQNESLSLISLAYEVPMESIIEWSGKSVETVYYGETLTIPLCLRSSVSGSTVTPSAAPDYPAPELLRPRDGEAFTLTNDTITLQWASVSELKENEYYLVSIVDLTAGENDMITIAVKDTKYIVPESMQPNENTPHIFKWTVVPVVQIGVDEAGNPKYRESGPSSQPSYFSWLGTSEQPTPLP